MKIEIKTADCVKDAEALSQMDVKIFPPSDAFSEPDLWLGYECFWIVLDGEVVGSTALGFNVEFSGRWEDDTPSPGCLYIASTAILPDFQRRGIGNFVKQWQIDFARRGGFTRVSTNCRKSNIASLKLNQKFGFKVVGEMDDFYEDPVEPVLILELELT